MNLKQKGKINPKYVQTTSNKKTNNVQPEGLNSKFGCFNL